MGDPKPDIEENPPPGPWVISVDYKGRS
jgi:hypothetical protein